MSCWHDDSECCLICMSHTFCTACLFKFNCSVTIGKHASYAFAANSLVNVLIEFCKETQCIQLALLWRLTAVKCCEADWDFCKVL